MAINPDISSNLTALLALVAAAPPSTPSSLPRTVITLATTTSVPSTAHAPSRPTVAIVASTVIAGSGLLIVAACFIVFYHRRSTRRRQLSNNNHIATDDSSPISPALDKESKLRSLVQEETAVGSRQKGTAISITLTETEPVDEDFVIIDHAYLSTRGDPPTALSTTNPTRNHNHATPLSPAGDSENAMPYFQRLKLLRRAGAMPRNKSEVIDEETLQDLLHQAKTNAPNNENSDQMTPKLVQVNLKGRDSVSSEDDHNMTPKLVNNFGDAQATNMTSYQTGEINSPGLNTNETVHRTSNEGFRTISPITEVTEGSSNHSELATISEHGTNSTRKDTANSSDVTLDTLLETTPGASTGDGFMGGVVTY